MLGLLVLPLMGAAAPGLQVESRSVTPNFKDADLTQIAEAVSAATGKNFIVDPRVRGQVTMLSSTPMSPAAFYEAFLAISRYMGSSRSRRATSSRSFRMRTPARSPRWTYPIV
jgi:general secretion pathway protein D